MRPPAVMLLLAIALVACRTAPQSIPAASRYIVTAMPIDVGVVSKGTLHRRRPGHLWCLVVAAGRVGVRHAVDAPTYSMRIGRWWRRDAVRRQSR